VAGADTAVMQALALALTDYAVQLKQKKAAEEQQAQTQ